MRQFVTGMRKSSSAALIWILKVFSQERYFDLVRIIAKDSTCTENNLTSKEIISEYRDLPWANWLKRLTISIVSQNLVRKHLMP